MALRARTWCSLVLVLSAPLAVGAQQPAQATNAVATPQPKNLTLETYFDLEDVQDPQLSPDGKQVIYTRRWVDKLNDRWESSLWIMNADGSRARHLVDGSNASWSPDGSRIAYLARGEPTGTQVWVRFMDGDAAPTQITRLTESPSDLEWSPDGKWLAFRMLVPERDEWRIPMPAAPKGAKWVEPPRVVTRLNYRRDRQGFIDNGFRQIFVVPADGGTARQVTSGPWEHGAPQWMKDGKAVVFSSLRTDSAEYAWRESEIYAVDVASGQVRQLTNRKGPDGNPRVSPTGKYIAYTGFDSTNATWQDSKLYVMNADGSNRRVLTESLDRSPGNLRWAPDESGIYYTVQSEGWQNVYFSP
ncbi:MAG TPA: DPP IV N-terminal domain-containing protein, partial [Gemmatimonadaceae bacterium]|nr:DPP IV N-terminal domain-containing protein [Gemmatimonadaceae bacterium]